MASAYDFEANTLDGKAATLKDYAGRVALIVNTASKCGFTPQYAGLETIYQQFRGRGFVVLGFPCNQFGSQEPGSEAEIGAFCQKNYGVTFPMFAKIDVNGPQAHPLYDFMKKQAPGVFGSTRIKANFTKFLIDRKGAVIARYATIRKPEHLARYIEAQLREQAS